MRLTSLGVTHGIGADQNNKRNAPFFREGWMVERKAAGVLVGLMAAVTGQAMAVPADAQENHAKKIKIGVIYDLTGPLAGGGSELQYIGAKIMLDQYAKTGVEGYKVEAVYAGAPRKPDLAINQSARLVGQGKADTLLGFIAAARFGPESRPV